jgi:hypothetical protein
MVGLGWRASTPQRNEKVPFRRSASLQPRLVPLPRTGPAGPARCSADCQNFGPGVRIWVAGAPGTCWTRPGPNRPDPGEPYRASTARPHAARVAGTAHREAVAAGGVSGGPFRRSRWAAGTDPSAGAYRVWPPGRGAARRGPDSEGRRWRAEPPRHRRATRRLRVRPGIGRAAARRCPANAGCVGRQLEGPGAYRAAAPHRRQPAGRRMRRKTASQCTV